ncbi:hypothetical protein BU26DRAFT_400386, partial [Trematosphaeria pertusa]
MAPHKSTTRSSAANVPEKTLSDGVKKPKRGYKKFRNGQLNVTPKGKYIDIILENVKSPLLRLPGKIRNAIWEYVVGGTTFDMHVKYRYKGRYAWRIPDAKAANTTKNQLSLLRVCRQIYAETAILPFKVNVFKF